MPTYEYNCKECDDTFEVKQSMSEDRLTTCTKCNSESLQQVLGASSFTLKGTGWYQTDFKDK